MMFSKLIGLRYILMCGLLLRRRWIVLDWKIGEGRGDGAWGVLLVFCVWGFLLCLGLVTLSVSPDKIPYLHEIAI